MASDARPSTTDGRRVAGAETRRRLVAAASELLADHGEAAVTLRAVGRVAGANSAAIQYHFGSREALVREVVTDAAGRVVVAQLAALDVLDARAARNAPIAAAEWVEAWAGPLISAATGQTEDERRLGRIVAQTLAAPFTDTDNHLRELTAEPTERLLRGLEDSVPGARRAELVLRVALSASALAGLASGAFEPLLREVDEAPDVPTRILATLTQLLVVTG